MILNNSNEISKAQIEVWSWKQSIHEEIKDMDVSVGLRYILQKAQKTMEEQFPLINNLEHAA